MEHILRHCRVPGSTGLDLEELRCFLVDLQARCLYSLHILASLIRLVYSVLPPEVSRTSCNLSSRVWILVFHRRTQSVYDMVHLAYPLVMGCTLWVLLSEIFCWSRILLFRSYAIPSFCGRSPGNYCLCTLRLLGCGSRSYHNCGISSFGHRIYFLCHRQVTVFVCYCSAGYC
jgi:hypothetical protein